MFRHRMLGLLSLLVSDGVLARAGGGGHSGGGGGHSGGGHGGVTFSSGGTHVGNGGGDGSFPTLLLILILVLVAWYLYRRYSQSPSDEFRHADPSPIGREAIGTGIGAAAGALAGAVAGAGRPTPDPALAEVLTQIAAADPGFELETFLQRAEMAFFLVKRAIQHNDEGGVRPFLDDALYDRVARGIRASTSLHRHVLLESLNVRGMHLIAARADAGRQALTVHFDLVYRAKTLNDAQQVVSDEGTDQRHAERWTFVRDGQAKTPVSGGATAARCPACGAELRLSLDGSCTHCKASVTNGSVDWVVDSVEPAAFAGYGRDLGFAVAAPTVAEGVKTLHEADNAFSIEAFLARVRTAFTTLQESWCAQDLDKGRAFLSQGAYFAWRSQLETMASEGRRNVMDHLSIRGVHPVRVVHGRVYDDLTVRIEAEATDYEVDGTGKIVFGSKSVEPFAELWTFQRSVGVATTGKPGTLENTCPSCGAPVALTQIGECRYCRAAVTSGRFDWVVSRIEQEDSADDDASPDDGASSTLTGAVVGGLIGALLSGVGNGGSDDD